MSYTPPSGAAADASWALEPLYAPPAGDAADASWVVSGTIPAVLSAAGTTSLGIHLTAVRAAQFAGAGAANVVWETDERAVVIAGAAALFMENPDRAAHITGGSSVQAVMQAVTAFSAAVATSTSVTAASQALHDRSFSVVAESSCAATGKARATGQFRVRAKTVVACAMTFQRIASFHVAAKARVQFSAPRRGDMRLRCRSRTIMRFRSGPWPW